MYGFTASSWCFVHLKNAQPCPFRLSRYVFFTTAEFSKLDEKQLKEEGHQWLNFQYLPRISFPQFQFSFLFIFNWTGSHHGNYSSWRVKSVKRWESLLKPASAFFLFARIIHTFTPLYDSYHLKDSAYKHFFRNILCHPSTHYQHHHHRWCTKAYSKQVSLLFILGEVCIKKIEELKDICHEAPPMANV